MNDFHTDTVLELRDLFVGYYKDLNILQDLTIKAQRNKITAVLGANGVGKSTALKAAFGFLKPFSGEVLLEGESILDIPTYNRILKGLAYIPQQPGVFKDMSVEENLELGGWTFRRDRKPPTNTTMGRSTGRSSRARIRVRVSRSTGWNRVRSTPLGITSAGVSTPSPRVASSMAVELTTNRSMTANGYLQWAPRIFLDRASSGIMVWV